MKRNGNQHAAFGYLGGDRYPRLTATEQPTPAITRRRLASLVHLVRASDTLGNRSKLWLEHFVPYFSGLPGS